MQRVLRGSAPVWDDAEVRALLEPDQIEQARREPFGRRHLTRGERAAMWALRLYAVLMLIVVIYAVVGVAHGG